MKPFFTKKDLDHLSPEDLATLRDKHARRWESAIRKECLALQEAGTAFVDKNWEAPRLPGRHEKREASKPDFSGHLSCARHVVFEAKTSLHFTRFNFANISAGQRRHLDDAHACGAVAFVYLLDNYRRRWVLPWGEILRRENVYDKSSFALPESPHFIESSDLEKQRGETWLKTYQRLELEGLT